MMVRIVGDKWKVDRQVRANMKKALDYAVTEYFIHNTEIKNAAWFCVQGHA
jgi:hypothetical protein